MIKRRYLAYLMRLWQIKDARKYVWRASLEDPHTGERQGFTSPEAMITFLWEQMRNNDQEDGSEQDLGGNE